MLICYSLRGCLAAHSQPTEEHTQKNYWAVFITSHFRGRASLIRDISPWRKVFVSLRCRNEKLIKWDNWILFAHWRWEGRFMFGVVYFSGAFFKARKGSVSLCYMVFLAQSHRLAENKTKGWVVIKKMKQKDNIFLCIFSDYTIYNFLAYFFTWCTCKKASIIQIPLFKWLHPPQKGKWADKMWIIESYKALLIKAPH